MVRPRKANKISMTTVSISENLMREMVKKKKSQETWYDFVNRIFIEWKGMKQELDDREEALESERRINSLLRKELVKLGMVQYEEKLH